MSKLNPQIETITVGIRESEMEELKIYPLSIADQLEMSDLIRKALQAFFGVKGEGESKGSSSPDDFSIEQMKDIEFVSFIIDLIQENIIKILSLVTDHQTEPKAKKLLSKISNNQAVDFCWKVYQMNYEESAKNAISLFKTITGIGQEKESIQANSLKRPLPPSSKDTLNSDLNIFSNSVSETGV